MVFARTSKAAARLSEQVRNKEFHKKYLAMCDGKLEPEKDIWKDFLLKNERKNMSRVVPEGTLGAKEAILDYEVCSYTYKTNLSTVKVNLQTGRHHQIRVQFASRGHSLFGDQKYGTRGRRKTAKIVGVLFKFCASNYKRKNGI